MAERNHYEVLGLRYDADSNDITKAYRKLAKKYHPDVNPNDPEAAQRMMEVNRAYEALNDPQRRKEYASAVGVDAKDEATPWEQAEYWEQPAPKAGAARRTKYIRVSLAVLVLLVIATTLALVVPYWNGGDSDRDALVALYEASDGANWYENENWLSNAPIGDWHGVTTDFLGRVTELYLVEKRLTGELPPELGNLSNLSWLDLSNNQLTEEIPTKLGNLSELFTLDLSENQLTGQISPELGDLLDLYTLDLSENRLTGQMPPELVNLPELQELYLYESQLTGCIPAALWNVTYNDLWSYGLRLWPPSLPFC